MYKRQAESAAAEVYRRLEGLAEHIEGVELRRVEGERVEIRCDVIFPTDFTAADLLRGLRENPAILSVEMHLP